MFKLVTFSKYVALSMMVLGLGLTTSFDTASAATPKKTASASSKKTASASLNKKAVKPKVTQRSRAKSKGTRKHSQKAKIVAQPRVPYEDIILASTGHLLLQSNAAFVLDSDRGNTLFSKNANRILPIASITKLMTAMVVLDANQNLSASIFIDEDDIDYLRGTNSRLPVGTELSREHALLLALMSSENRAANSLARHYPGGLQACIAAMNKKARELGMKSTRFHDPTGLSNSNVSTAADLALMVGAAYNYPKIREFSTTENVTVALGERRMEFRNTNALVKNPNWEIYVSKTGFIREAGRCLVMFAKVANKPVSIVLLDATGQPARLSDANRIKRWMEIF